jgi:hypothetical protein
VNSREKEGVPLANIERNPLVLLTSAALTAALAFLTYYTIFNKDVLQIKPVGFFLFVPTAVISFQTLWFLLNPFAIIFEDKMEIKQSLFHNKFWHYVDIKEVGDVRNGTFKIIYNDHEIEKMNLMGIKSSHKALLREELNKQVYISLVKRGEVEKQESSK